MHMYSGTNIVSVGEILNKYFYMHIGIFPTFMCCEDIVGVHAYLLNRNH